jgi:hypothetical protein
LLHKPVKTCKWQFFALDDDTCFHSVALMKNVRA